jgi:hypothetical protein
LRNDVENLVSSIVECNKHFLRVFTVYKEISVLMPLDEKKYDSLSDIAVKNIDQYLFRFSKIQDSMGRKMFPYFLLSLGEEIKTIPFVDMLNRIEELLSIKISDEWLELRKIRNDLTHEYEEDSAGNASTLNAIFEKTKFLFQVYTAIKDYSIERFPEAVEKLKETPRLYFPIS